MADGDLILGGSERLYLNDLGAAVGAADNTALSTGSDWVHVENVVDNIDHDPNRQTATIHERNRGVVMHLVGDPDNMLRFKVSKRPGLACYDTLQDSYNNKTTVGVMIATGSRAVVGTRGTCFDGVVTKFASGAPNDANASTVDVEISPSGHNTFAPFAPVEFEITA